jgi:hypothetical protein
MEDKIDKNQTTKNNIKKETETLKFEDNLWDLYEGLHERYRRQYNYLSNLKTIFTKYRAGISDFSKSNLNIVKAKYQLEESNNSQNDALLSLVSNISKQGEAFDYFEKAIPGYIIQKLDSILDPVYYEEKDKYNNLKKAYSNYIYAQNSVEKAKKTFYNSASAAENQLRVVIKTKEIDVSQANIETLNKLESKKNDLINEAKNYENKYILEIQNANKLRIDFNQKQNDILQFYEKRDENSGEEIKIMLMLFVAELKKDIQIITNNIQDFEENIKKIDIKKDINEFIELNKGTVKPDEEIIFYPYEPITKITETKESEEFKYNVMREMKLNFNGIFPDFNQEFEDKKSELRKMTVNFFKTNVKFNEQEKLLEYLKEKKFRDYFLINLSKQRTQGRYARKEEIINNLKEVLNLILEIAEKEKDYESGKNCIILSQTYYIEDKNDKNKKIYLIESIQDNNWLKSINFWNGIIDLMIKKEIEKNYKINKNNDENEQKKISSNAGFSQLLSYSNNMVEFKIDKDIIKHIIDKFAIKYNIEKNLVEAIYANSGITGEIDINAYDPNEDLIEDEKKDIKIDEMKNEENIKEDIKNEKNNEENNSDKNKLDYVILDNEEKKDEGNIDEGKGNVNDENI